MAENEQQQQQAKKVLGYEQSRQERIKENLQRMREMGIVDLSLKLKSLPPPKRNTIRTPKDDPQKHPSYLPPSGPLRRSSRLQNVTPVRFSEAAPSKRRGLLEDEDVKSEHGSKPEVYTEEHEKLLGNTERSWTLFMDGCGKDGKRIYDPIRGKTCHQCRQKTLGYRTHCSKCQMVQGQFCGDCLYMRYGEHVLDAIENPNWICPVCRGICNCSLCRQSKGWAPTGVIYRKISSLGYKSVAHYLIQTRRSQINAANQTSVTRSLPFSETETPSKESLWVNEEKIEQVKLEPESNLQEDEFASEKDNQRLGCRHATTCAQAKRSLHFSSCSVKLEKKPSHGAKPSPDSIGGRFQLRHRMGNGHNNDGVELKAVDEKNSDLKQAMDYLLDQELQKKQVTLVRNGKHACSATAFDCSPELKKKPSLTAEPGPDSIAGRVRLRRGMSNVHERGDSGLKAVHEENPHHQQAANMLNQEFEREQALPADGKHACSNIALLGSGTKPQKKRSCDVEPSPDSIGGRLRLRRRSNNGSGNGPQREE